MKNKKSGISLIVLVITIIIMIILAGAIILTLTNSNIIYRSNKGVTDYNESLAQEQVQLYDADRKMSGSSDITSINRKVLVNAITKEKINIDKFFIYDDKPSDMQLVLFKYAEVTPTERTELFNKGYLYLKGDANLDNKIDDQDSERIDQHTAGENIIPTGSAQFILSDINGDSNINVYDKGNINNIKAGLRSIFSMYTPTEQVRAYDLIYYTKTGKHITDLNKTSLEKAISMYNVAIYDLFIYEDKNDKQLVLYKFDKLNTAKRELLDSKGYLYLKGDANFDTQLNSEDIDIMTSFLIENINLNANQQEVLDYNNDGNINSTDLSVMNLAFNQPLLSVFGLTDQTIID